MVKNSAHHCPLSLFSWVRETRLRLWALPTTPYRKGQVVPRSHFCHAKKTAFSWEDLFPGSDSACLISECLLIHFLMKWVISWSGTLDGPSLVLLACLLTFSSRLNSISGRERVGLFGAVSTIVAVCASALCFFLKFFNTVLKVYFFKGVHKFLRESFWLIGQLSLSKQWSDI